MQVALIVAGSVSIVGIIAILALNLIFDKWNQALVPVTENESPT